MYIEYMHVMLTKQCYDWSGQTEGYDHCEYDEMPGILDPIEEIILRSLRWRRGGKEGGRGEEEGGERVSDGEREEVGRERGREGGNERGNEGEKERRR